MNFLLLLVTAIIIPDNVTTLYPWFLIERSSTFTAIPLISVFFIIEIFAKFARFNCSLTNHSNHSIPVIIHALTPFNNCAKTKGNKFYVNRISGITLGRAIGNPCNTYPLNAIAIQLHVILLIEKFN